MEIKWLGTATVQVVNEDDSILFDPFLPLNNELPAPAIEELAGMGDIFITHGHFDHLMHIADILQAGNNKVHCSKEAAQSLLRDGVAQSRIVVVSPGDNFAKGSLDITVFKGAHIRFDLPLIIKTLFSRRTVKKFNELKALLKAAKLYPEGEVLAYQIRAGEKTAFHLGSLNLDQSITYPTDCDLLILPFQGRSDLNTYTLKFIEQLNPKAIYLHHFDDSFPPISSTVDTDSFVTKIANLYPNLRVIVPDYNEPFTL